MEKILSDILKELQYQTKLMEEIYQRPNKNTDAMKRQMDLLKIQLANHPIFKGNPEMTEMFNNIFSIMPKGDQE